MKASARAVKAPPGKFCNCATGDREGGLAIHATPESLRVAEESGSTLNSRCPLLDACQALAKIFANFVPSRKYMKCGIILSTVFLSPASARTRGHDIVCFGWEL